jgi:hypothetical protein
MYVAPAVPTAAITAAVAKKDITFPPVIEALQMHCQEY